MKDQLSSPDFDSNQYERPNQNWVCGWAKEGKPCRIGPDPKGGCRATFECKPSLERREGETTGRFRCTRPKEFGGPCEHGPAPDGTCGRAIPPCQPDRSLRSKRGVFTWSIVALTVAGLLVALYGPARMHFVSPGKISSQHSATGCADCHRAAANGPATWSSAALAADPGPLEFGKFLKPDKKSMTHIDQSCQRCHTRHNFHEPNVARDFSCSACHNEHLGGGAMKAPDSANCVVCHGDREFMDASFAKGKNLPPGAFDYRSDHGQIVFKTPRPERGYTQVFTSFATDHPEFQVHAQRLKESNTLKFNHRLHLSNSVRKENGDHLDCVNCHKPDFSFAFRQQISFEENCRECHSLQFDKRNPKLQLPHGNPEATRDFLRSLETQYADLGRQNGVTEKRALENFVRNQMRTLQQESRTGEDLERDVFFSTERKSLDGRPLYSGCAFCHEVQPRGAMVPKIVKPQIPDRWLARGRFDHAKHLTVDCTHCHKASQSDRTEDILLPTKASCVTCHSPKGGVRSDCATCHGFHSSADVKLVEK